MSQRRLIMTLHSMTVGLCASLISLAALAGESPPRPAPSASIAPVAQVPGTQTTETSLQRQRQALEQQRLQARERTQEIRSRREQLQTQRRMEQEVRRQLQAARQKLEVAAQQVAELSARLAGPAIRRLQRLTNPRQGLLGIQLDNSGGTAGAHIRAVSPGGAAEQAGVRAGDLIVAVNGTDVRGQDPARRVMQLMRNVRPGAKVTLRVLRGSEPREFTVIAKPGIFDALFGPGSSPSRPVPPRPPQLRPFGFSTWPGPVLLAGPLSDMELVKLTPQLGRYFGTDTGVLVVRAPPHGALGLRDGDVILSIGGRRPVDSSQVIRILDSYDPGQKIALHVMRMHHEIDITTAMPARRASRKSA